MGASMMKEGKTLKEQVRDHVFTMIRESHMKPGERFPAQQKLAVSLNVSQKIVEVVYNELETEHLIVRRPGKGTFLAEGSMDFPQIRQDSRNVFFLFPTLRNHYFAECAANMEVALQAHHMNLRIITREASPRISDVTKIIVREGAVGIIAMFNPKGLRFFAQKYDIPMVDVRSQPLQARRPTHWKTLLMDIGASALLLGEHLWKLGHRDIYLAGDLPQENGTVEYRFKFLKKFFEKRGGTVRYLPQNQAISAYSSYEAIGEELAQRMLKEGLPGTAAVFFNSARAVGAMRELKRHHVRIPEDISLCGFDKPSIVMDAEPCLTHTFFSNAMEKAVDLLLAPGEHDQRNLIINPTLSVGTSTSTPRNGVSR